jgi:assimilatory nitrate reductase catalytic subunit
VALAQAFMAMHWGPEYLAGSGVNALTSPALCPQSGQPELKHPAVRVERAALAWQIAVAVWLPADQAMALRETLRGFFVHFEFAHCVPFGREPDLRVGLRFRATTA